MGTRRYLGQWRKETGHKIVKGVFDKTDWDSYKTVLPVLLFELQG